MEDPTPLSVGILEEKGTRENEHIWNLKNSEMADFIYQ